jgi:hypothetical protein
MDPEVLPRGGPIEAELRAVTDEARVADAAAARRRKRWLLQQASEESRFAGVLLDLGEREQLLAVTTRTGRTVRGVVRTIGEDFVGLRAPSGEGTIVPLAAITSVRAEPGALPALGDRLVRLDTGLATVLHDLAAERPWVSLHLACGGRMAGELHSVGRDLLVLCSPNGTAIYVPLATVSDVVLP